MSRNYYRVMLGQASAHAAEGFAGQFIGVDFGVDLDLTALLGEAWREFSARVVPEYLASHPGKGKISAGLACGALWTLSKGMQLGDLVLCPDNTGGYKVGEISGGYYHVAEDVLPHRRPVRWIESDIKRVEMSDALRNSTGSIGTIGNITAHALEIEKLLHEDLEIAAEEQPAGAALEAGRFEMETHLESFLFANWKHTELGHDFTIFEEEGQLVGKQYRIEAGTIDILAISKDRKRLLVVELKRGRASDEVVGQILRYMGCVKADLAEADQTVEGVIIALDDDQRLRWALALVPSISFYRYKVSFQLLKG